MRLRMGQGILGKVRDGLRALWEVRDGSGDPLRGPGQFVRLSGRSETGRGTLGEVQDGSGDAREGPGRVGGPSGRSEMSRRPSRRSRTGHHREGPGRVGGPLGRSGTGCGTRCEDRYGQRTNEEVRDGSGDPRGGPGQVGVPRKGMGRLV